MKLLPATPTLYGEDARNLLASMERERTNPDPVRIARIRHCKDIYRRLGHGFELTHDSIIR